MENQINIKKSFKCKCGFHDLVTIKTANEFNLHNEVCKELDLDDEYSIFDRLTFMSCFPDIKDLHLRICIRPGCDYIDDEITKTKNKIRNKLEKNKKDDELKKLRQDIANMKYKRQNKDNDGNY